MGKNTQRRRLHLVEGTREALCSVPAEGVNKPAVRRRSPINL